MNNNSRKIIYISGVGRSGTTLLDMIISTSSKVFSAGEIFKFHQMYDDNIKCSCGKNFHDCNFWKYFYNKNNNYNIINHVKISNYFKLACQLYNPFSRTFTFNKYSNDLKLFDKIFSLQDSQIEFILDSSKDILRLIELNQNPKIEVYNINIVRDGRAVANSYNSKTQSRGKNYFFSLIKWIFINKLIFKYQNDFKLNFINISCKIH